MSCRSRSVQAGLFALLVRRTPEAVETPVGEGHHLFYRPSCFDGRELPYEKSEDADHSSCRAQQHCAVSETDDQQKVRWGVETGASICCAGTEEGHGVVEPLAAVRLA